MCGIQSILNLAVRSRPGAWGHQVLLPFDPGGDDGGGLGGGAGSGSLGSANAGEPEASGIGRRVRELVPGA